MGCPLRVTHTQVTLEDNPSFHRKGPTVRMMRWFSLLEAIKFYDPYWTSWVHLMQWVAKSLAGSDADADKVAERVARLHLEAQERQAVAGVASTTEGEKLKIAQLKKVHGIGFPVWIPRQGAAKEFPPCWSTAFP